MSEQQNEREKSGSGFAAMSLERPTEIPHQGGAAQQQGKAHEWTAVEAKAVGRKRGQMPGTTPKYLKDEREPLL